MQVKKQLLELEMEQGSVSNLWRDYDKAVHCHAAYLTYMQKYIMQNAGLEKSQAGIKIARKNINNLRYVDDKHSNGRKGKRN